MKHDITVTRTAMPPFEEYIEKIRVLWNSRWLTNMGTYHREFEEKLRIYLDVPQLSLMVNGHMSLELAIQAMNFPEGSEVITTPFTFISTTHAVIRNRLVPVFCDIKLEDYTIDEEKIEDLITEKTVAVLPVHVYGNICNLKKIEEIADKYNLKVIYDAAHAFGEKIDGRGIGSFGDVSVFSFHATKVFHTIEGGAAAFSDLKLYQKLYDLKNFGIHSEEVVAEVGANAKMNEFSAAMGLCNLPYVETHVAERQKRTFYYIEKLRHIEGIRLPEYERENIEYSYGYFPVLFSPEIFGAGIRDLIYQELRKNQVQARKYFYPITLDAPCFRNKYRKVPLENARYAGENILVLPLYPELEFEKMDDIIAVIESICEKRCC